MKLQLHEAKIDLGRIALRLLQNHLTSFGSSSLIARDTAEHDQEKLELESLTKILIDNENTVRLASFVALLAVFGAVEIFIPRVRDENKTVRWAGNLGLSLLNGLLLRLVFPVLALGAAEVAQRNEWGVFNVVHVPYAVAFLATLLALDFAIYLQHLVFHYLPLLWRFHRVHHTDIVLDVSSAVRFHFVEIMISMVIKLCAVVLLGPPVLAVLAFEVWLNATSMFHHSNLRIPPKHDRWLRWIIVTPDMHRVHHSAAKEETNSNFAFNLPWWDRMLGTYWAQPRAGHEAMTIGLEYFRGTRDQYLDRLLIQPLVNEERKPEKPVDGESQSHGMKMNG